MTDQTYVSEILAAMPRGLTRDEFYRRCQRDINAGYRAEVDEAWHRYQGQAQ